MKLRIEFNPYIGLGKSGERKRYFNISKKDKWYVEIIKQSHSKKYFKEQERYWEPTKTIKMDLFSFLESEYNKPTYYGFCEEMSIYSIDEVGLLKWRYYADDGRVFLKAKLKK